MGGVRREYRKERRIKLNVSMSEMTVRKWLLKMPSDREDKSVDHICYSGVMRFVSYA